MPSYIGAFILNPDPTTDLYTKHRLGAFPPIASCDSCDGIVPPSEAIVFQSGNGNPLIGFGENRGAVAVCADIGRPSHPQQAGDRIANTYLANMFVSEAGELLVRLDTAGCGIAVIAETPQDRRTRAIMLEK